VLAYKYCTSRLLYFNIRLYVDWTVQYVSKLDIQCTCSVCMWTPLPVVCACMCLCCRSNLHVACGNVCDSRI